MMYRSFFSKLILTLLTVVISTAGVLFTTRFLGSLPLSISQTVTEKGSTFDVTGQSEVSSIPDEAQVTLGVTTRRNTVASAQDESNSVINAIIDDLQQMGVKKEDIKTQNYSIHPEYDYNHPGQPIIGYIVNANLVVTLTDFDKINQAIDAATRRGANQVGGVNFSLSHDKEKEVLKQAREEAIADAKDRAEQLAKLSGMKLGRIVNVAESPLPGIYPIMMEKAIAMPDAGGGEPTQIEPGSTTTNYSVTLSYETL